MKKKSKLNAREAFSASYDLLLLIYRLKIIDLDIANQALLIVASNDMGYNSEI